MKTIPLALLAAGMGAAFVLMFNPGADSNKPNSGVIQRSPGIKSAHQAHGAPRLGLHVSRVPMFISLAGSRMLSISNDRRVSIQSAFDSPDGWINTEWNFSASFDISAFAIQDFENLFISGLNARGDTIIEHWHINARAGEHALGTNPQSGPPPIGTSSPWTMPQVHVVAGQPLTEAEQRVPPPLDRTQVIVTDGIPEIKILGADPEGRFLLALATDGILYQIPTDDPSAASPVLDAATTLPLADARWMLRYQHSQNGRLWILGHPPTMGSNEQFEPSYVTILFDAENDGIFENTQVMTRSAAKHLGFTDPDFFETDFVYSG